MQGDCATQTKQTQLDTRRLDQSRRRLIDDGQVVDLVLARAELFHNAHILDQTPNGEDGDGEGEGAREQVGDLREGEVNRRAVQLLDERNASSLWRDGQELAAGDGGNEGRVLEKVAEDPV